MFMMYGSYSYKTAPQSFSLLIYRSTDCMEYEMMFMFTDILYVIYKSWLRRSDEFCRTYAPI